MKRIYKTVLKNGQECTIRNAGNSDGQAVLDLLEKEYGESDYLLSYPGEQTFTAQGENEFLQAKADSDNEVMLVAEIDGKIVAISSVSSLGTREKIKHRAEFAVSVLKDYWGLGIGRKLMELSVECSKEAGYKQLELEVVAENERALDMYKSVGFVEFGRNPMGFISRYSGPMEMVYMRLGL